MSLCRASSLALPVLASTAAAQPFAAPTGPVSGTASAASGLGQVTLALGLVLLAIFGFAWLARRLRGVVNRPGGVIEILGDVALGPKERAVLLKVAGVRVLVGVAAGQVNTLHVLGEDPAASASASASTSGTVTATGGEGAAIGAATAPAARPSFRDLLARSLGR